MSAWLIAVSRSGAVRRSRSRRSPRAAGSRQAGAPRGRLLLLLLTAVAIHLLFPAPRLPDAASRAGRRRAARRDRRSRLRHPQGARTSCCASSWRPPAAFRRSTSHVRPPPTACSPASAPLRVGGLDRARTRREQRARARCAPSWSEPDLADAGSDRPLPRPARRTSCAVDREGGPRPLPAGRRALSLSPGSRRSGWRCPSGLERLVPRDSLMTPDRFFSLAAERLAGQGADAASCSG
jgi:hypothetical protein